MTGLSRRFATVLHAVPFSDNARRAIEYRGIFPLAERNEVMAGLQLTPEQYLEVELELYAFGVWGVVATSDGPALIWGVPR